MGQEAVVERIGELTGVETREEVSDVCGRGRETVPLWWRGALG